MILNIETLFCGLQLQTIKLIEKKNNRNNC